MKLGYGTTPEVVRTGRWLCISGAWAGVCYLLDPHNRSANACSGSAPTVALTHPRVYRAPQDSPCPFPKPRSAASFSTFSESAP